MRISGLDTVDHGGPDACLLDVAMFTHGVDIKCAGTN